MTRTRSSLARLLQFTTLAVLAGAIGWLGWHWEQSPWIAVTGFLLIAFGYCAFLALEFVALRWVHGDDPAPKPHWNQLARAWLRETMQAPLVFCWRQPFRWRAAPDRVGPAPALRGQRGVVFIHGFVCNRGFWTPWLERMAQGDNAFVAVNLEPVFGSIDDYAPIIDRAVSSVAE
ncbi:MAG: permease, partial [Gammaproteobacteria bacterium]|nr:permease [Gammaproteobacteria bacterium]